MDDNRILDDQIQRDIKYKIAFAPSLFFYLIDCMFTAFLKVDTSE